MVDGVGALLAHRPFEGLFKVAHRTRRTGSELFYVNIHGLQIAALPEGDVAGVDESRLVSSGIEGHPALLRPKPGLHPAMGHEGASTVD